MDFAPYATTALHIFARSFRVFSDGMAIPRSKSVSMMEGPSLLKNLAGARVCEELMIGSPWHQWGYRGMD